METPFYQNPAILWFIFGIVGLLLELVVPGLILFFFGLGAIITAITFWLFQIGLEFQLLLFLVSSSVLLTFFRKSMKKSFFEKETSQSDELEEEFAGKTAQAITDFEGGQGKVQFKGTTWSALSDDSIRNGDAVEIIKRDSITLIIKLK